MSTQKQKPKKLKQLIKYLGHKRSCCNSHNTEIITSTQNSSTTAFFSDGYFKEISKNSPFEGANKKVLFENYLDPYSLLKDEFSSLGFSEESEENLNDFIKIVIEYFKTNNYEIEELKHLEEHPIKYWDRYLMEFCNVISKYDEKTNNDDFTLDFFDNDTFATLKKDRDESGLLDFDKINLIDIYRQLNIEDKMQYLENDSTRKNSTIIKVLKALNIDTKGKSSNEIKRLYILNYNDFFYKTLFEPFGDELQYSAEIHKLLEDKCHHELKASSTEVRTYLKGSFDNLSLILQQSYQIARSVKTLLNYHLLKIKKHDTVNFETIEHQATDIIINGKNNSFPLYEKTIEAFLESVLQIQMNIFKDKDVDTPKESTLLDNYGEFISTLNTTFKQNRQAKQSKHSK